MGQRKRTSTQWMLETLSSPSDSESTHFPPEFICGLRGALEAGLSCEQLTAMIVLATGIYEAGERMSGSELVERAVHLTSLMKGDICFRSEERERARKNREFRKSKALLAKKRQRN